MTGTLLYPQYQRFAFHLLIKYQMEMLQKLVLQHLHLFFGGECLSQILLILGSYEQSYFKKSRIIIPLGSRLTSLSQDIGC